MTEMMIVMPVRVVWTLYHDQIDYSLRKSMMMKVKMTRELQQHNLDGRIGY